MIPKGRLHKFVQHYPAGSLIFREGDVGNQMYIILDGRVNIRKKTGDQSYKTLIVLQKGDVFGEMAIVEMKPRSATAITEVDCRLMVLDRDAFYLLVSQNSDFAIKMIKSLSARLRKADHLIEQILGADMEKQVFEGLCSFFDQRRFADNQVASGRISLGEFIKWTSLNMGMNQDTVRNAVDNLAKKHVLHYWKDDPNDLQIQVSVNAMLKNRY